jgi:hypothetical protein
MFEFLTLAVILYFPEKVHKRAPLGMSQSHKPPAEKCITLRWRGLCGLAPYNFQKRKKKEKCVSSWKLPSL